MIITKNEELKFDVYNIDLYDNFKKSVNFFKEIKEEFDIEEILPDFKKSEWKESFFKKKEKLFKLDEKHEYIKTFDNENERLKKLMYPIQL